MGPEGSSDAKPSGRPRRRRRRQLLTAIVVVAVCAVAADRAYRYAVNPERLVRLAESHLSRFVTGRVRVGDARFTLFDGIRLTDVTIDAPPTRAGDDSDRGAASETPTVFACRRVDLQHRPLSLLLGDLRLDAVTAIEPTCTVVHDDATGRTNIADILRPRPGTSHRDGVPQPLPVIELRNACVRVLDRLDGKLREVEDLTLNVRARPVPHAPDRYDIVWNSRNTDTPGGHSRLDLNTGFIRNVRGGLPSMSIEAVMLAINAKYDGVGVWTNLLGLGGRVRASDYNLIGEASGPDVRSVTIELTDASISIPINAEEQPLPRDQRYLRFTGVNGTVVATTQELRADFTGRFHGSPCSVKATLRSDLDELKSLDDVAFDVRLSARDWTLPRVDDGAAEQEVRFVRAFPPLAKAYRDFDPHGVVDLDIHATKEAGHDAPVVLQGATIAVRGGDVWSRMFPYRGQDATGTIEIGPDGVFVRDLRCTHDDGTVTINASFERLDACARAEFDIEGANIPIDAKLFDALRPEHRRTAKRFSPEGRLDIHVDLRRDACREGETRGRWSTAVTLKLKDNAASYDHFPFPIEGLTGTINIESGRTRVLDVTGRPRGPSAEASTDEGEAEATVKVYGDISFDRREVNGIDLTIDAVNVPVDAALADALPPGLRERLVAFRPEGRFDCTTKLAFDEASRSIRHKSHVTLKGLHVRHERFPLPLRDVSGMLVITPDRIEAQRLAARYGDATVLLSGAVDPKEPSRHTNLSVNGHNVVLDDVLRAALPPDWRARLGGWRIDGPLDLDLAIESSGLAPDPWKVFGKAELSGAAVSHRQSPLRLAGVRGSISFDQSGARGHDITGHIGEAIVQLGFDTSCNGGPRSGSLRLAASRLRLEQTLRDLLPERYHTAWDRLGLRGEVDLDIDRIEFASDADGGAPLWTIGGRMNLHDVDMRGSVNVAGATGTISFDGALRDRLGGQTLSGQMQLTQANVLDRALRRYESDWSLVRTGEGAGRLELSRAQAELYGGSVAGDLELAIGPEGSTYRLSATVQGAQLNPIVNSERTPRARPGEPADVHGILDAHLYLSGVWGDRTARRGGGQFEITDGRIYKLPLMSAILHVLNLSLPLENALDSAQASFFVVGNRVEFPSVALGGESIQLAGSGTMTVPDYSVDLNLINVNPRRWARVPVLTDFVEGASRELLVVHVAGPIGHPTVRTRPLAGLSDEFKRLFQKRDAVSVKSTSPTE